MDTTKIIRLHSCVLIICSIIGGLGYYLQYNYFQITSCIPAIIGCVLLLITTLNFKNKRIQFMLLFLVTLVFGIILTRMSVKFIPQQFQPMRKRLYFPVMALSSIIAVIIMAGNYTKAKRNGHKLL
ncbi:hypothetical protein [Mucilaginibacter sp.]|uniref:hypothetical protein n=1 Tax=Mucilaginibacter sp. TaxID=1882438 RepID=UPI0025E0CF9E|nr:hypothetical protein [Mucilaginibacter sp.]